jgi:hypothetical protein
MLVIGLFFASGCASLPPPAALATRAAMHDYPECDDFRPLGVQRGRRGVDVCGELRLYGWLGRLAQDQSAPPRVVEPRREDRADIGALMLTAHVRPRRVRVAFLAIDHHAYFTAEYRGDRRCVPTLTAAGVAIARDAPTHATHTDGTSRVVTRLGARDLTMLAGASVELRTCRGTFALDADVARELRAWADAVTSLTAAREPSVAMRTSE